VAVEVVPYAEAEVAAVDCDMADNYLSSLDDVFHHMSCHAGLPLRKSLSFRISNRWSGDVRSAEHVPSFRILCC